MPLIGPTPYAVDTTRAIKFLEAQDHRNVITYADLDEGMGFDVRENRHNLATAIKYMERVHERHFIVVRRVGIKEAEPSETATYLDNGRRYIGRKARRLVKTARTIDASGMSGTELQSFAANTYLLDRLAKDTHHEGHKRIAAKIGDIKQLPNLGQIAKMVNGGMN